MKKLKNKIESDIEVHLLVCTNERKEKNKSCGKSGSIPLYKYLKDRMRSVSEKYQKRVKVNSTSCLSNCASGPVVVSYPAGNWFSIKTIKDVDVLIGDLETEWMQEIKLKRAAGS